MKTLLNAIERSDAEIQDAKRTLSILEGRRTDLFNMILERLKQGETTGDHVRDMVIRKMRKIDMSMEQQVRALESRMNGRVGELILFPYVVRRCTKHVFVQTPWSHNEYEEFRFVACGLLNAERMRLYSSSHFVDIELPVDTFVYAPAGPYGRPGAFERLHHSPFTEPGLTSPGILQYAGARASDAGSDRFLCVGDDEVRTFFEHACAPEAFVQCCEILGKLVLTSE